MADRLKRKVAGIFNKAYEKLSDGTRGEVVVVGKSALPTGGATEATQLTRAKESTLATRASEATQQLIRAKTDNLDMKLSAMLAQLMGEGSSAGPADLTELWLALLNIQMEIANNASEATLAAILAELNGTTGLRVQSGEPAIIAVTPTITAGAYSAKDAVGGKLEFDGVGNKGHITSLTIIDNASQAAELVLNIFDRDFTATADNSPYDPSDADQANCLFHIRIIASDYQLNNDNGQATLQGLWLPYKCYGDATKLYGQLMCIGGPTYAATTDLTAKLGVDKA